MSRPKFRFIAHRGLPAPLKAEVRSLRQWVKTFDFSHDVECWFVPHDGVQSFDESNDGNGNASKVAWGIFDYQCTPLRIAVAGGLYRILMEDHSDTPEDALRETLLVFFHELAHYEQFRDGKPLIERGVNVRAKGLWRKYSTWKETTNQIIDSPIPP